ncbi:MAG: thioredoxin family protein [Ignavibacteriaceae bacterium]
MKHLFLLLMFFFSLLSTTSILQESTIAKNDLPLTFDEKRDPQADLKYVVSLAKKEKKNIILDVGGEWCIWCKRLDKFFEENSKLNEYLKANYIVLKVNYSKANKNESFLSRYPKVDGYPHFFVLNKKGKLLHSQNTGKLEAGDGYDFNKIMEFLKKWRPKK